MLSYMAQKTPNISISRFYELADKYYLSARCLAWFCCCADYPTTFLGHQALELYFKAISAKESGTYNDNQHDLQLLYDHVKSLKSTYSTTEVDQAVDHYRHYDQPARYTSEESRRQPANPQMGTFLIDSLDAAVAKLRDTSIITDSGIDRLVEGEIMFSKMGVDPLLALHSVIFFQNNKAFAPKKPDIQTQVNFGPPTWPKIGPNFFPPLEIPADQTT
jgi:hypothetical protein